MLLLSLFINLKTLTGTYICFQTIFSYIFLIIRFIIIENRHINYFHSSKSAISFNRIDKCYLLLLNEHYIFKKKTFYYGLCIIQVTFYFVSSIKKVFFSKIHYQKNLSSLITGTIVLTISIACI